MRQTVWGITAKLTGTNSHFLSVLLFREWNLFNVEMHVKPFEHSVSALNKCLCDLLGLLGTTRRCVQMEFWTGHHMLFSGPYTCLNRATFFQWMEPKNGFLYLSTHISFEYLIIHFRIGQVGYSGLTVLASGTACYFLVLLKALIAF